MLTRLIALLLGVAVAGSADVTLRYSFNVQPGPMMPPQAVEAMKSQMKMPARMMSVLKGNKAYAEIMGMTAITNFDGALITVIDAANKRYATVSSTEYVSTVTKRMELPEQARQALAAMKMDITAKATGRTKIIHGIGAEEREIVFTVEMPSGTAGSPGAMRIVYSVWAPNAEARATNPAIQEFARYCERAYTGMNPGQVVGNMFGQVPGFSEKLRALTDELKGMSVILEGRIGMYMPGMAAMMEKMRKSGNPMPAFDPNAPMMEMLTELEELSTAPVPDSRFEIPQDYTVAPLSELMKGILPAPRAKPEVTVER